MIYLILTVSIVFLALAGWAAWEFVRLGLEERDCREIKGHIATYYEGRK